MSGLVCVFARDGAPVVAADVEAVLQRQAHRGPDGLALWCGGPAGLGLAALDPTGTGKAIEPVVEDGGRLVVVGDLRIDNRGELTRLFDLPTAAASDADIVLAAYRRWGIDAPSHIEGAFAFVVWDARKQRVVCARDHLGQKPLTYHLSDRLLVAASEAEAVPCHPGVPRRINKARIADFLVSELEGVDHTSTFFEGVERLPPAHLLVVEPHRHQLWRYWEPDVETELHLGSDEEYAEAFSEVFQQAVKTCLDGIAAPGLLLSGGIDSGAIAAFAGSLAENGDVAPVKTFSVIDRENDSSPETTCILSMIDHLRVEARTFSPIMVAGLSSSFRRSLLNCGEPFDACMLPDTLLYSMAADAGTRVVLDGVDGDIVVSTSTPVPHLLRRGHGLRAWREVAAHRDLFPGAPHPLRAIIGGALRLWMPGRLSRAASLIRNRPGRFEASMAESLIGGDFARVVGVAGRLDELWSRGWDDPRGDPRAAHSRRVTHPYVAAALERFDRVSSRRGIDSRHPFFDLQLVRLCLSLPWDLKVRNGWTKFVLRLATRGLVMDGIRGRHDHGGVLWRPTSRVISEERSFLRSILQDPGGELAPYVDHRKLEKIRKALHGNPNQQEEVSIWEASTLARWLARRHW